MKRILAQWINYCNYQTNFCSMPKERVQLLLRYKIEDVLNDLCSFFICVFFFFSFFFNLRVLTIIWIARKPIHFLQQGNVGFYVYFYFFSFPLLFFYSFITNKKTDACCSFACKKWELYIRYDFLFSCYFNILNENICCVDTIKRKVLIK